MGTKQHFVLYENVSGYSIFLVKEFDEIIRHFSAHVNSFLKPVAFVPFNSVGDALENVQAINEGRVSPLLSTFLRQNLPAKDAVLGVADQTLGESILTLEIGFECMWDASIREIIRIIRSNSSRLLRSLIVQPGAAGDAASTSKSTSSAQETIPGRQAEKRARLVVALSRARLQLDLLQHLADTGVVRSLELLDSMDASLGKSMKRLRAAYGLHFPELCRAGGLSGVDDYAFANIVAHSPQRDVLTRDVAQLTSWLNGDSSVADQVISLAKSSTGQDISSDDIQTLQQYGQFLLKLLKSRSGCCEMLERRVRSLVPNLTALMDKALPGTEDSASLERVRRVGDQVSSVFVVARLLSHAVNLDRLAKMPSSRVNSLGASKSLFRQSGAVAATSAGLLGRTVAQATGDTSTAASSNGPSAAISSLTKSIVEMSGGRLRPVVVRRRVARLLAAKSTLACRADCYRRMNPFQGETSSSNATAASVPQLDSGEYGANLGEEAKRQLRVWAEANGVQLERTVEELEKQRDNRKKYRKAKRKAWLRRKTATVAPTAPAPPSSKKAVPPVKQVNGGNGEQKVEMDISVTTAAKVSMSRKRPAQPSSSEDEHEEENLHTPPPPASKRTKSQSAKKPKAAMTTPPKRTLRSAKRQAATAL